MDHNETAALGHDIYQEGLHVDIARRNESTVHVKISDNTLPSIRGIVIRGCTDYLEENAQYFIDVFEGDRSAANPPKWPDGGKSPHTLISTKHINAGMSKEQSREDPSEEVISIDELTEILAEAEGVTPEKIDQGAEELDLAPPQEATVLNE